MQSFGPGFLPTFLYYSVTTTVIVEIVVTQGLGASLETGIPFELGLPAGVLAGLVGAYFNRTILMEIPFEHRPTFVKTLTDTLTQLGYAEIGQFDEFSVYERTGLSKFLSGKIFVRVEKTSATIAGRSRMVRNLQRLMDSGKATH